MQETMWFMNELRGRKKQFRYHEIVNILEKANDFVLPQKVIEKEKLIGQQTEALVKKWITLRNK